MTCRTSVRWTFVYSAVDTKTENPTSETAVLTSRPWRNRKHSPDGLDWKEDSESTPAIKLHVEELNL